MRTRLALFLIIGSLVSISRVFAGETDLKAYAVLHNIEEEKIGKAIFEEVEQGGVAVKLKLSKVTPGLHGLHIHAVGECVGPDFKSAGGHFNPLGKEHGLKNPKGHHAGDLRNIAIGNNGKVQMQFVLKGVTLGEGKNSLFHEGGTSLVLHAEPDDEKTDPAGNSGPRIACGIIIKK